MLAQNTEKWDSDFESVKIYFDEEKWNIFSANEKKIYAMVKRNYEDLKAIGANPTTPDFMLQKKKTEDTTGSQTNIKERTVEKKCWYRNDKPPLDICKCFKKIPREVKEEPINTGSSPHIPIKQETHQQSSKLAYHKEVKQEFSLYSDVSDITTVKMNGKIIGLYAKKSVAPQDRGKRGKKKGTSKSTRKRYNCPQCNLITAHKNYLRRHIDAVHKKIRRYSCQQCNYKASQSYHVILHTRAVHEVIKPYRCQDCNYKATQAVHLRRHIDGVHKKKKPFKCPKCDYCSSEIQNLRKHIDAVHENIKPYKCVQCDYKAAIACNLRRHVSDVHDEIKPYSCEKCDFKSSNARAVQQHTNGVHYGIKPYVCQECDFKTSWPRNLRKHVKRVHEKKKEA